MFAHVYAYSERRGFKWHFRYCCPKPVFIVVCLYHLDSAIDWMPVKDVNDVLINVFFFFFFFFYSGSFINIYYLISITFPVVSTVTGVYNK
jgi:hypothetical protein